MHLTLPFPPTANTYYRHIVVKGRPRSLLSAKGRAYREQVAIALMEQWIKPKTLTGPLSMTVEFNAPDKRVRDLDNLAKGLLDSLEHAGVYKNDSQIRELHMYWREAKKGGSCSVIIEELLGCRHYPVVV